MATKLKALFQRKEDKKPIMPCAKCGCECKGGVSHRIDIKNPGHRPERVVVCTKCYNKLNNSLKRY